MILELFEPQGENLDTANSWTSSVVLSKIDAQLQSGGTYSMRVRNDSVATGSYTLSVTKIPPSTILTLIPRLGGDACVSLVAGCSIDGTIDFPGQVHRYSFDANAGDNVFIELVEGEGMEYMDLELFDPQGENLDTANSWTSSVVVSIIDEQLQTGGLYLLVVSQHGVKTGSYTLSFIKAPP
jgi:hypothetical protein